MAENARPATDWNPRLRCRVGSADVGRAHRLLMGGADFLPPHDVYFLGRDAMTATEPSLELVERFQPNLLPLAKGMTGHRSFLNCDKLKQVVGWEHRATWRG